MSILNKIETIANVVSGSVYRHYSGRGMFGKQCFGVSCEDSTACIEAAGEQGIKGAKVDNLGKGWIVYWPHLADPR